MAKRIVIAGGGSAGISVAARLRNEEPEAEITIIDPQEMHYYQPLWTLVGGGVFEREETARPQASVIPDGATWLKKSVEGFDPENNQVLVEGGDKVPYDVLVVTLGIQLDWDRVEGLKESLGTNGVCSNYTYETVPYTWQTLQSLKSGRAIFTFPSTPIKCAGAPQKIMWLAEHWLEKQGHRDDTEILFASAGGAIFGVPKYRAALEKLVDERKIETLFHHDLVRVDGPAKKATFKHMDTGEEKTITFDMLHVTPHQSAPEVIKKSKLASEAGWVDVDMYTTQHVRYPNVFSLGDSSSLPNSKTGAAVRKQAPVAVENIRAFMAGKPLEGRYDGYASCPLVTGYGRLILAEFKYGGELAETFPFDQAKERYSMYAMKAYALPDLYWHGMLRGRA